MRTSRSLWFATFLLLFVLPFALRILPLEHGGERTFIPDNTMVRAALGMARDHDLAPEVGKYSAYPNLLPYLLLPLYGVQFVIGRISGAWGSVQEFGQHMLAHPQHAAWIARLLVALFGTLTTWVIWRAARAAGLARGAWVAAWLAATGLLSVQFSTHERPWAPVVFFMAATAWAAIVYAREPRGRTLAIAGALAGLSFATHPSGIGALAIVGIAWMFGALGWKGSALRARLVQGVVAVALFAVVSLVAGHAQLLKYGWTPKEHAIGGLKTHTDPDALNIGTGVSFVPRIRAESFVRLSQQIAGYDPVVLLLGLAGVLFALRDRRLRGVTLFTLAWALVFMTNHNDHVRYLLPVTVLLALPAGLFVERSWERKGLRVALLALLAFPLVQAARFDWVMMHADTRTLAEERLAHLPSSAHVAIDRYGPVVDLDRAALYTLITLRNTRGRALGAREEFRKREIDSGSPESVGLNAVHIEDVFGFNEENDLTFDRRRQSATLHPELASLGKTPTEVFASLGITHYLRVDRRPVEKAPDLLFGAQLPGKVAWTIDPAGGSGCVGEALLPLEMDFALTGLWCVERPGPLLELRGL